MYTQSFTVSKLPFRRDAVLKSFWYRSLKGDPLPPNQTAKFYQFVLGYHRKLYVWLIRIRHTLWQSLNRFSGPAVTVANIEKQDRLSSTGRLSCNLLAFNCSFVTRARVDFLASVKTNICCVNRNNVTFYFSIGKSAYLYLLSLSYCRTRTPRVGGPSLSSP